MGEEQKDSWTQSGPPWPETFAVAGAGICFFGVRGCQLLHDTLSQPMPAVENNMGLKLMLLSM